MAARMDWEPGIWSGAMPVAAPGRPGRGHPRRAARLIGRPWFRVEQLTGLRVKKNAGAPGPRTNSRPARPRQKIGATKLLTVESPLW